MIETKIISFCLDRIANAEAEVGEVETHTRLMLWCFMHVSCMLCMYRGCRCMFICISPWSLTSPSTNLVEVQWRSCLTKGTVPKHLFSLTGNMEHPLDAAYRKTSKCFHLCCAFKLYVLNLFADWSLLKHGNPRHSCSRTTMVPKRSFLSPRIFYKKSGTKNVYFVSLHIANI